MKNKLLAAMALCCATSMSVWAGNWEKPTITSFVDPDLTIPTEEIPTTGYKYLRGLGDYYLYHLSTGMFLTAGNNYGTQMSLGTTGQKISLSYGHDRILYNADSYPYVGWLLEMPGAPSNSADNKRYHELYISSQYNGWVDGVAGHMLWSILPQADGTYRITVIQDDPDYGPGGSMDIPAESYMGRNPESAEDQTTVIIPLATPAVNPLAEVNWKFVSVETYDAYQAKYPLYELLNTVEEAGMPGLDTYAAIYNNAASTKEELEQALEDLSEAYKKYQLDNALATATPDNPVDLTSFIQNADCASTDGWTKVGNVNTQSNGEHWSDASPVNVYIEPCNWDATGWEASFSQTITDMPNGLYRLRAAGRAETNAKLYLVCNGVKSQFPSMSGTGGTIAKDGTEWESVEAGIAAGKEFANENKGRGWNYVTIEVTVLDGTITIGAESSTTDVHQWASVDDFQLLYLGKVSSDVVFAQLQSVIDAAEAYKAEVEANRAKYSIAGGEAFDNDLAAAKELVANTSATENEVVAMITKLQESKEAFEYDVEVYGKMEDKFAELDAKTADLPEDVELPNYYDYYDELWDAVDNRTFDPADYEGITAKADELFMADFFEAVKNGQISDITLLITNPDFANGTTGWTGAPSIEYGIGEKYSNDAGFTFDVYQEITGLPAGTYEISADGFYRPGSNADWSANYGAENDTYNTICSYLYGNEGQAPMLHIANFAVAENPGVGSFVQVSVPNDPSIDGMYVPNTRQAVDYLVNTVGGYPRTSVKCYVGEDGVLRFGVKGVGAINGANWTPFDNFKINYLGADDIEGYKVSLESVLNTAKDLINTPDVKAKNDLAALKSLATSIEMAMGEYTTTTQYTDALAQLNEAMALVQEGIDLAKTGYQQACIYVENYNNDAYADYDADMAYALYEAAEEFQVIYEDNDFATLEEIKGLYSGLVEAYKAMIFANTNASAESPLNVTSLLSTPSFEDANGAKSSEGWTVVKSDGDNNLCSVTNDGKTYNLYEMYDNGSFDMSQKVYGLQAGWYYVDVQGYYRAGTTAEASKARHDSIDARNVQLYVTTSEGQTSETDICSIFEGIVQCMSIDPVPGYYSNDQAIPDDYLIEGDSKELINYVPYSVTGAAVRFDLIDAYHNLLAFEVKDGVEYVQIGLKKEDRQKLSADWAIFDNFQLFYTGTEKPNISTAIEGIEEATADVVSSTYYTIGGIRIAKPAQSGLYIREDLLSDGTKKVTKILVK